MSDDLTERVIAVIAATQHIAPEKITPESTFAELGIDSLDGINILFALENEFSINIPDESAQTIRGIPDVVQGVRSLLDAKGGAEAAVPSN